MGLLSRCRLPFLEETCIVEVAVDSTSGLWQTCPNSTLGLHGYPFSSSSSSSSSSEKKVQLSVNLRVQQHREHKLTLS
ncbi:unnamed protein product [Musa hybrid cultivar]